MRPTPTKSIARLSKTQESKRDNNQPTGKQHADYQSEENTNDRDGKGEKEEERKGKKSKLNALIFFYFF